MKLRLANPRGFCAGVDRAIEIVERALDRFGAPIHVRHEVVHNKYVVDGLRRRGAVFVEEVDEVPAGATLIFSAHGVSRAVREAAEQRGLRVFDATCPLVTKVHIEVAAHAREGRDCVLIGHRGHPEVEGTMGQYQSAGGRIHLVEDESDARTLQVAQPDNLAYVTQTTLSMDDTARIVAVLRERFDAAWLKQHKFPPGYVLVLPDSEQAFGAKLDELHAAGWKTIKTGIGRTKAFAEAFLQRRLDAVMVPEPAKADTPRKAKVAKEWKDIRKKL